MRVSATQNQKTENNSFNPLKWAAIGAIGGYIVKNELPITEYEREHYQYDDRMAKAHESIKSVVNQEIEFIKKSAKSGKKYDEGVDLFVKYHDNNASELTKSKILKLVETKSPHVKETFNNLSKQIADKSDEVKSAIRLSLDSTANRLRPYPAYLGISALFVTAIAFLAHVISRMSSDPQA